MKNLLSNNWNHLEFWIEGGEFSRVSGINEQIGRVEHLSEADGLRIEVKSPKTSKRNTCAEKTTVVRLGDLSLFIVVKDDDGQIKLTWRGKSLRCTKKLADGMISVFFTPSEDDEDEIPHVSSILLKPADMLWEYFRISGRETRAPGGTYTEAWEMPCRGSLTGIEEQDLTWVLGDGVEASLADGTPVEIGDEQLLFYDGDIQFHIAETATWVVKVIHRSNGNGDFYREITLITERPNLFLLARELENFLEKAGLGGFEDCLEPFID